MSKVIRNLCISLAVLLVIFCYVQWNHFGQKEELREDGLLYFKEQDYAKTIQYMERAQNISCLFASKIDEDMESYEAESYYQLKEYGKALELFGNLVDDHPKTDRFYMRKGQCYQGQKRYSKAIKTYQKGWEKTKEGVFLDKICDIYLSRDNYTTALKYVKQGAKEQGQLGQKFAFKTIVVYEYAENYDKAYQAAKVYCKKYPKDAKGSKELQFLESRI